MGAVFYFYPYPGTRLFNICKEYDLLSDKMEGLSGYLEKPAITLTHCTEKDCIQEYNRLRLFLVSCGFVNSLKLPEIFGQILYLLLNVCSKFWVNLITKNSGLKYQVRKLFYRYRFR